MINQNGFFEGRETKKLFYQKWLPDSGIIKAYIIALHGWGTHSDRIIVPAEYFTEKGYAIYAFDIRGHWRNSGDFPGHFDSMDHIQKDIVLFMDLIKKQANDEKIFLMGHAFGALISLIFAINHPAIPGVIASSPLLKYIKDFSLSRKLGRKISGPISMISPNKTMEMNIEQNFLTSDIKILRKHISDDKRINEISWRSAAEMERSMKWTFENAPKLLCPTLILQAGNDKLVDKGTNRKFFERIKSTDKTYREYDGLLHELWQEKGRAQVFQDMFIWLEKHIKSQK
ncbi:MAG TPA: lysophospholipase [Candidatus Nanopelagicaceae bacterium]|jgi:alpha-beta hydrolase superfamily lysophospholipase|nr:lysophospholipase [Candidatus Nanopelagicaceae bacterium]